MSSVGLAPAKGKPRNRSSRKSSVMKAATPRTPQQIFFITGTTIPLGRIVETGRDRVAAPRWISATGLTAGGVAIAVAMIHHSN